MLLKVRQTGSFGTGATDRGPGTASLVRADPHRSQITYLPPRKRRGSLSRIKPGREDGPTTGPRRQLELFGIAKNLSLSKKMGLFIKMGRPTTHHGTKQRLEQTHKCM